MAAQQDPQELEKQFKRLQTLATTLRKDLTQFDLSNLRNDAALVGELLEKWEDELTAATASVDSMASAFQNAVSEISKGNKGLNDTKRSFNKLTSLAQDIQSHNAGINKLSSKQLQSLKKQALQEQLKLQTTLDTLEADKQAIIAARRSGEQNAQQLEQLRKISAAQNEIRGTINGQNQAFEDLITNAKEYDRQAKNIEDALGLGGNALKGMQDSMTKMGLGGLADKLGLDEAKEAMEEMASELTNGGENAATLGDKFKIMGAGMKSAFSGLGKSLLGPEALIAEMVDALKSADEATGKLAKDFNLTYSEALSTRRELSNMATMSGDVALNAGALQESMVAVGQSLGTNAKLNDADLKTFTKLREQAGFTNDELVGIQKLSLVNGKTLEDNTKEILGGAEAYATRNGFVVNEKDVLKEVSKASASLKLTLGGSAEAVAVAAVKAKQFGLNLEQAEKISESLLQFESSIENELSAELLTGKELNFEKARSLALEGKTADAAAEVAKQVGTSADFSKMNVIQQEALAKAAGMTKDELAQSLMDREALTKLSGVEGKDAKEKFNNLVKQVGLEKAKQQLGNEQLANQFAQQSVQERFAQATEKLKEVFVSLAEPVLAFISPIVDLVSTILPLINVLLQPVVFVVQTIASVFTSIKNLIAESIPGLVTFGLVLAGILLNQQKIAFAQKEGWLYSTYEYAMKKKDLVLTTLATAKETFLTNIKQKGLLKTIAEAAMTAFKSVASIPIVGPILGAAAAAGAVALGYSLMKGNDVMSPGDGSTGYGKRTLFGPEGAIQLNNKDTVIAGTDLFKKGDDVMSAPKGAITVNNATAPKPAPVDSNTLLAAQMKRSNDLKEQEMRRDRTVSTLRIQ
jgi:hypothetical protein